MNITPPSTPAPKPASPAPATPPPAPPTTGPKLSLFTLDGDETRFFQPTDEEAEKRMRDQQLRLQPLRQEFEKMATERRALRKQGQDVTALTVQLHDAWHDGLFSSWHRGTWSELYPLMLGIARVNLGAFRENIFVLGGQFGSLSRSFSKLIPPPASLMEALEKYHAFPKTAELIDQYIADPNLANEQALSDCCNATPDLFVPAIDGGGWNPTTLRELVSIPLPKLRASVENRLFNLPASTMVFEPTPADPAAGWHQFWKFAGLFQQLPDHTKDKFKPLHFTIRPTP